MVLLRSDKLNFSFQRCGRSSRRIHGSWTTFGCDVDQSVLGEYLPAIVGLYPEPQYVQSSFMLAILIDARVETAHYMKIPTRSVFLAQVIPTIITSFLTIGIIDWQFGNIADFCSPENTSTCKISFVYSRPLNKFNYSWLYLPSCLCLQHCCYHLGRYWVSRITPYIV